MTEELQTWMTGLLDEYSRTLSRDRRHLIEQYTFVDIARKVVGVGSVGTRAWIILLRGADDKDPLILQAKEATTSVLEPHTTSSEFRSHGERVVQGQRLMQAYGDVLLGWHHSPRHRQAPHYYIRQLRDWKGSMLVESLPPRISRRTPATAPGLSLAHTPGPVIDWPSRATSARRTGFDNASPTSRQATRTSTSSDFAQLEQAVVDGRIVARRGV